MAWGLEGKQIGIGWALALTWHVGFRGRHQTVAVALMCAESGRWTGAWHENIIDGQVDSIDHGLYQINDKWHPDFGPEAWYDPIKNTAYAHKMSRGMYFTPWMAFVNNAHLKFIPQVWAVKSLGKWKKKIPLVKERFGEWPYGGGPKL